MQGDLAGLEQALNKETRTKAFSRKRARSVSVGKVSHCEYRLACHPAAVDDQNVSIDVVARRRREKYGGARKIVRRAPPSSRDSRADLGESRRVVAQALRVVGREIARRNRVDLGTVSRPLVRQ